MAYRKKSSQKVTKKVARSVKTYVAKAIKGAAEPKFVSFPISTTNVGATSATGSYYTDMAFPIQGTAQNQRIGDRIQMTSLQLRLSFATRPASISITAPGTQVRVMLVLLPNAATITTIAALEADLFLGTISGNYFNAIVQKDKQSVVLFDRKITKSYGGTDTLVMQFDKNKALKQRVEFAAGTTTVEKNRLGLYVATSNTTPSDCVMYGSLRWNYVDL